VCARFCNNQIKSRRWSFGPNEIKAINKTWPVQQIMGSRWEHFVHTYQLIYVGPVAVKTRSRHYVSVDNASLAVKWERTSIWSRNCVIKNTSLFPRLFSVLRRPLVTKTTLHFIHLPVYTGDGDVILSTTVTAAMLDVHFLWFFTTSGLDCSRLLTWPVWFSEDP